MTDAFQRLLALYPWPAARPDLPPDLQGWFGNGHRAFLGRFIGPETRCVVELGSWKGLSTSYFLETVPRAEVAAVDHWLGSPEHRGDRSLPRLYDQFVANTWAHRDRLAAVRTTTLDGLEAIKVAGLQPDLVYVDAAHDEASVAADLDAAHRLFPAAVLAGDDWSDTWPGVVAAVAKFADGGGYRVEREAQVWALTRS